MLNTKDKISFRIPVLVLADILLISVSFLITHTFVIHYADHTMDTFSDVLKSLIIYDAITVLSLICFGSYRKKILSKVIYSDKRDINDLQSECLDLKIIFVNF